MRSNFIRIILLTTILASLLMPVSGALAQTPVPPTKVQAVLASMTPEERVGQLFLVTFRGTDTSTSSQIYDLIVNHHVGGVVLLAENDNFLGEPDTIAGTHQLISSLQTLEWDTTASLSPTPDRNTYVPLFIGIAQDGDGAPHDQILNGLTALPDAMAIGATWNTDLAGQVGNVLGSELSALGFNLYLGPSLDVLESPNPSALSDLGTRVFGGDPYWVGEMGRAFVAGLHEGSGNQMTVVAKNFPGKGGSDRSPEEEVATVRKSLEQLKQVELSPFFAITNSMDPATLADGLLVSHIRYQGFQGNIRATTRPVSFDAAALSEILALPEFTAWRENGGVMVSDALGSKAVRDFYTQGGENFSLRTVARDAFSAGNELLYVGNVTSTDLDSDTYTATLEILNFFTQEYRSDPVFSQRVDAAVARIIAQKFRMYDLFTLSNVLAPDFNLSLVGASQSVMFDVARNAATLVSPDPQELNTLLPAPPNQSDRMVFLTDTSLYQQCTGCPLQDTFAADALQRVVVRLYGQSGSEQIFTSRLASFPFFELENMLNEESESNIEAALDRSTWIVIALTDVRDGQLDLLRRFFSERPNLIRNKNVILFSFTAPYYLDATDISKLTAYYSLYSKQQPFVDVAVRLLFQQISPAGASPVSIPAVGYDLITATSPDPAQVIPLALDLSGSGEVPPAGTPTIALTETPTYKIGDTIALQAGPIIDHNGHTVPNGTIARFVMSTRDESGAILQQVESTTEKGVARASFLIDKPGQVEINVSSEPAVISGAIQFDASDAGVAVTVVVPMVTAAPEIVIPTPTVLVENDLYSPEGYPRLGAWLLVLLALVGGALLVYWAVNSLTDTRWAMRFALSAVVGGLLSYNYLALGFPGAAEWIAADGGAYGILLLVFGGELLGLIGAWLWMRLANEPASRAG
ncbi:MAG TPA: glycoside hydrolase family 3 N-terminal domain-containing protein [Anaerolineales bacterium]|nr:glycoside hydrolase family 3 N-terminal domain-containing protein [Anaerolineales bacterium]